MENPSRQVAIRLLPLLLAVIVLTAWIADVQSNGPYVLRNILPPFVLLLPVAVALNRNGGRFGGADPRLLLAAIGFGIPSVGLSIYLHYAYAVNLDGLFADSTRPAEVFRYLPIYTSGAGLIGAAIGWIIGRSARDGVKP